MPPIPPFECGHSHLEITIVPVPRPQSSKRLYRKDRTLSIEFFYHPEIECSVQTRNVDRSELLESHSFQDQPLVHQLIENKLLIR